MGRFRLMIGVLVIIVIAGIINFIYLNKEDDKQLVISSDTTISRIDHVNNQAYASTDMSPEERIAADQEIMSNIEESSFIGESVEQSEGFKDSWLGHSDALYYCTLPPKKILYELNKEYGFFVRKEDVELMEDFLIPELERTKTFINEKCVGRYTYQLDRQEQQLEKPDQPIDEAFIEDTSPSSYYIYTLSWKMEEGMS